MELVIDANILFAALIRKSITSELLMHEDLSFFAPEYILEEFEKYQELIRKKTNIEEGLFKELLRIYYSRIELIPEEEISKHNQEARSISPDIHDVPYFALALLLHVPIWSNDKAMREKQKAVDVFTTEDLVHRLL